jgi:MFS family permease
MNTTSTRIRTCNGNCKDIRTFLYTIVWPGLGLLGESYMLFSIGTLRPLWEYIILSTSTDGNNNVVQDNNQQYESQYTQSLRIINQLPYSACCSIMMGMLFFGCYADTYGRRYGSICTSFCMLLGSIIMTCTAVTMVRYNGNANGNGNGNGNTFIWWYLLLFGMILFAFGVGGEYPVAAASATESSIQQQQQQQQQQQEQEQNDVRNQNQNQTNQPDGLKHTQQLEQERQEQHEQEQEHKSGKHIQLIFTMQGVGILLQVSILTISLFILSKYTIANDNNNDQSNVLLLGYSIIWLVLYCIGTGILFIVFITRIIHLQESDIWKQKNTNSTLQTNSEVHASTDFQRATASSTKQNVVSTLSKQQPQKNIQPKSLLQLAMIHQPSIVPPTTSSLSSPIPSCISNVSSLSIPSVCMVDHQDCINKNTSYRQLRNVTTSLPVPFNEPNNSLQQQQEQKVPDATNINMNHPPSTITIITILLFQSHYGLRLLSVSISWFLWDVAFYGNKLFQSTFLLALTNTDSNNNDNNGNNDLKSTIQLSIAATVNAIVALLGYIAAAYVIDHPYIGRRRLQLYGFFITGILFIGVGCLYDTISTNVLILMYFGTSFFGQFGPNATTFILPSEIFPTKLRTMCHGIAAASGKFGALLATIMFHRISNNIDLFLLSGYTSLLAAVITYWFIPETVGHDLTENDRHWNYILISYTSPSTNEQHQMHLNHYYQDPAYLSLHEQRQQLLKLNGVSDYGRCDDSLVYE